PNVCSLPHLFAGSVLHIFRVKALSIHATDGTYSDFGKGQGEVATVRLLTTLVSPEHLKRGVIFQLHPFPGAVDEFGSSEPDHLLVGRNYLVVYPFAMPRELKPTDVLGLTRCGLIEDSPSNASHLRQKVRHNTSPTH
ncbi:MAG: hypothetical protein WB439_12910, partial [Acidobacteriaceae bacterium]